MEPSCLVGIGAGLPLSAQESWGELVPWCLDPPSTSKECDSVSAPLNLQRALASHFCTLYTLVSLWPLGHSPARTTGLSRSVSQNSFAGSSTSGPAGAPTALPASAWPASCPSPSPADTACPHRRCFGSPGPNLLGDTASAFEVALGASHRPKLCSRLTANPVPCYVSDAPVLWRTKFKPL